MSKYLVKLKPLSPYFIGGENTFGEGPKANYFAESLWMPQQSTLLGMLRYKVLKIHDLLGLGMLEHKAMAKNLIGAASFSLEQSLARPQDFGVIRSLSPLFISDEHEANSFYTAMPLDHGIKVSFENLVNCLWSGKATQGLPILENFRPKTYDNYLHYVNPEGVKLNDVLKDRYKDLKKKEWKQVFSCSEQIGITKTTGGESNNDAFFKQKMISLHPDLCFVCTVEIAEEIPEAQREDFVFMGANRSMFKLSMRKTDLDFTASDGMNYFGKLARENRYLLLSDAYLKDEVFEKVSFIWGESVSMRTIVNQVENGVSWGKPEKSPLYHLQAKGSVLYGNESIAGRLIIEGLRKVGLNIFLQPKNTIRK